MNGHVRRWGARSAVDAMMLALLAATGISAQVPGSIGPRFGAGAEPLEPHRTGLFDATLPVRSPLSEPGPWGERFQFPGTLDDVDYDLSAESFSVYVPPDYDPAGEAYGVVVWVSPLNDGRIPESYRDPLDERGLIWIAAHNAGNQHHLYNRAGLALDAAENVSRAYHVDRDRIFVSGLSGGGRVAAMLAVDFSDVFGGGFPIIGVTTHLDVRLEASPGQRVLQFPTPPSDLLERAREQPMVILTGSGDYNREECRLTAEALEGDGFTDVHLLDVAGMGHEMPTARDFGRGLDLLMGRSG